MKDSGESQAEQTGRSLSTVAERTPNLVFQPQKLKEVVDIIDLMGNIASRVREDHSQDMGGAGAATGGAAQTGQAHTGTSARDQAIANIPPVPIMQKKLITHLEKEIRTIERRARKLARSNARGSAFLLSELYKKIRRLTSLIGDMIRASAEVIKRFYISVFIDHQPMVVTGGSIVGEE